MKKYYCDICEEEIIGEPPFKTPRDLGFATQTQLEVLEAWGYKKTHSECRRQWIKEIDDYIKSLIEEKRNKS